jgi:hypothetical protein
MAGTIVLPIPTILFVFIHAIRDEARSAAARKRTAAGKAVQTE